MWEFIATLVALVSCVALVVRAPYRRAKFRASVGAGKLLNVEVEVDRDMPDPE
jgi:hypothetical protein